MLMRNYLIAFILSFIVGYLITSLLISEDKPLGFIILNSNDE